jgi:hypothetical protein
MLLSSRSITLMAFATNGRIAHNESYYNRPLVRGHQRRRDVLVGDGEQDAHALGRRERRVKPRHRRSRGHGAQDRTVGRVAPARQGHELRALHTTVGHETEVSCGGTAPPARRLAAARAIVLGAGGDLRVVVLQAPASGSELADRQHRPNRLAQKAPGPKRSEIARKERADRWALRRNKSAAKRRVFWFL